MNELIEKVVDFKNKNGSFNHANLKYEASNQTDDDEETNDQQTDEEFKKHQSQQHSISGRLKNDTNEQFEHDSDYLIVHSSSPVNGDYSDVDEDDLIDYGQNDNTPDNNYNNNLNVNGNDTYNDGENEHDEDIEDDDDDNNNNSLQVSANQALYLQAK